MFIIFQRFYLLEFLFSMSESQMLRCWVWNPVGLYSIAMNLWFHRPSLWFANTDSLENRWRTGWERLWTICVDLTPLCIHTQTQRFFFSICSLKTYPHKAIFLYFAVSTNRLLANVLFKNNNAILRWIQYCSITKSGPKSVNPFCFFLKPPCTVCPHAAVLLACYSKCFSSLVRDLICPEGLKRAVCFVWR